MSIFGSCSFPNLGRTLALTPRQDYARRRVDGRQAAVVVILKGLTRSVRTPPPCSTTITLATYREQATGGSRPGYLPSIKTT